MNPTSKKPRPPACDACKARKVLCHRQPNGLPCPRCVEKGILCKTTYVPRGRPRKNPPSDLHQPVIETTSPIICDAPEPGGSNVALWRPNFSTELSSELVQDLFESFTHSPFPRLPIFENIDIAATLAAASWKIDLLPPETRVLAYCICAQASLISFHPRIIGPGPKPLSLVDRSVLFPGADLRVYGMRRAAACRALYELAVDLACEARIHLRPSNCNAVSCFILGNLDESPSRPWTISYMSHVRTLITHDGSIVEKITWGAFLMMEVLPGVLERKPIVLTYADQLLLTGPEPRPLDQILETLRPMAQPSSGKAVAHMVYTSIRPALFHIGRLARELHDKITGVHARREPISEKAVIDFLSALAMLQSIVSLLFTQVNWQLEPQPILKHPPYTSDEENVQSCTFSISVGFTSLVIALHREMDYRASISSRSDGKQQDRWTLERTALLRQQAHAMASSAVDDVARLLKLTPFPPDSLLINCVGLIPWAEFCLEEADAAGGIFPERIFAFECILEMLKAFGYSRDFTDSHNSLIERMEAHLASRKAMDLMVPSQNLALTFPDVDDMNTWGFPIM
ncbi:hypothetical protein FB45DRAFT_910354 [Roridomyces roridus]|uniref:Zn(2)-C6 fungal-type domain-containing protein n=1 Tax=Roridomyces roridus TaxID=1738132 RepID=A0AAD7FRE9_9AGAR|nr:hypothetical protein FB45DRAFT_910354 [Roridomyces roridus]